MKIMRGPDELIQLFFTATELGGGSRRECADIVSEIEGVTKTEVLDSIRVWEAGLSEK